MKEITSGQFRSVIDRDPAWASRLTEPVEITGYCDMAGSKITHLSKLLHFTGKNSEGECARFDDCKSLKVAQGKFSGYTNFSRSGIDKIINLTCGENSDGNSASFSGCNSLKVAAGHFSGSVTFYWAGIIKIGDLTCGRDNNGWSASFINCNYLKIAKGKFPGAVSFADSGIEKIENLICEKNNEGIRLDVEACKYLMGIPKCFNPIEIEAEDGLITRLKADRSKEAAKKHLQTGILEI